MERRWQPSAIPLPDGTGGGKGVACGDVDRDGQPDLVFTCESANAPRHGVVWLRNAGRSGAGPWTARAISGPVGIKFDRVELVDLDDDGDLDVLTCEESHPVEGRRRGLGVIWYENCAATPSQ